MTPEIRALVHFATTAPATDPGEGYWRDIEHAYLAGVKAAEFKAAEKIRLALRTMGIDPPAGRSLCKGCSQYESDGSHDPDCAIEAGPDQDEQQDGES